MPHKVSSALSSGKENIYIYLSVLRYRDKLNTIEATLICRTKMLPIAFVCSYLHATSITHLFFIFLRGENYPEPVIHLYS